nr:MAG TPA: hypothetical protein [Caudoviricetes sp.]
MNLIPFVYSSEEPTNGATHVMVCPSRSSVTLDPASV